MTCKRLTALSRKIMKANGKTSGCVGSWKIQAHIASCEDCQELRGNKILVSAL